MERAFEFSCPICGSLCQTTQDMRGKQMQCLMCLSDIIAPKETGQAEGLDIEYFLKAGVVTRRMKSEGDTEPPSEAVVDQRTPPGREQQPTAEAADTTAPAESASPSGQPAEADQRAGEPSAETSGPSDQPDRLLFRDSVQLDGQSIPLAISNRKLEGRGLVPIPVEQLCGLRLEVTPKRDKVTGVIRYYGPHQDVRKYSIEISRVMASKVAKVTADFLAAMQQVMGAEAEVELIDQNPEAGESFWSELKAKAKG